MGLLLDAYMQWFHIGSYRLAGLFSQRGGLVHAKGLVLAQKAVCCRNVKTSHIQ
jgi:hypothetical protein